ncbi:MAG TPA: NAD-dependent epimerase/dehydratase family protein [Propionibacteriaceae bacterium]|nr:NAD-dependent epimerase/dehydratase family protein [Propionibacteriaceae bacterium]
MRTLILGGTAWLGAQLARTARDRGSQVTCLARGVSGAAPPGVELVRADRIRPEAYDQVRDRDWDAVFDVSRHPGQVRTAVEALHGRAGLFVFVSSGNVYADHRAPGQDEGAPLLDPLDSDVMSSMADYGEAKVACEQHVQRVIGPDRALVARVGLIGGPGDPFDRSGYWPHRFARPATADRAVLVPNAPGLSTQLIDVRDLAAWLVDAAARRLSGTYNVAGPTLALADHLEVARQVAEHTAPVVPVDEEWLTDQGVQPWMGERSLPLWLNDPDWLGFNARDTSAAGAAGLRTRPLAETLADTLAWELTQDPDRVRLAGLTVADERELLEAWRSRKPTTSFPGS